MRKRGAQAATTRTGRVGAEDSAGIPSRTSKLFHVPSEACSSGTAQTAGMTRLAALSGDSVGSRAIWMGQTHVAPGVTSGPHHHGESETGIYVVSGRSVAS